MHKKDAHFLFFSEQFSGNTVLLNSDEVGHLSNVLRFSEGDEIQITDGKGNIFESKIVRMKKDSAICEVISKTFVSPPKTEITVAVGLPEKEKLEDICEMLPPLGVSKIIPLITTKCQRNYADIRWEKVATRCNRKIISSVKQSLNPYITILENPIALNEFLENVETRHALSLLADFGGKRINEVVGTENPKGAATIAVFVGPPSGFTAEEIDLISKNAQKIDLGKYRLRTELAVVSAVAGLVQVL